MSLLMHRVELISEGSSLTPASLRHSWIYLYPVLPPSTSNPPKSAETSASSLVSPSSSCTLLRTYNNDIAEHPATSVTAEPTPIAAPLAELGAALPPAGENPFPNPFDPDFSRTAFLRKRLFARESEWSSRTPLRQV